MRRRDFITLVGSSAAAWPFAVCAQQRAMPVIGFLSTGSLKTLPAGFLAAFRRGLNEAGYVEGQNVTIEYRFAEGQYDRLSALAAELVRLSVAVIVTSGAPAAPAAKNATATIPVVFVFPGDPVASGLVVSLNRPGSNLTGVSFIIAELGTKKLELLRELIPKAVTIAMLVNPANATSEAERVDVQSAARVLGQNIEILTASSDSDLDAASERLTRQKPSALLVGSDPFFINRRERLVSLAARHGVPTLYAVREFVAAGGLMSYGTDLADAYRQGGTYAGQILKGAKPADLPVVQSTKFELVINLKTAKALGLTIPDKLLALADEVIE